MKAIKGPHCIASYKEGNGNRTNRLRLPYDDKETILENEQYIEST